MSTRRKSDDRESGRSSSLTRRGDVRMDDQEEHYVGLEDDAVDDMNDGDEERLMSKQKRRTGGTVTFMPAKSVEGWILMVRNVHEEAQDEDILEGFSQFGTINNLHLNLDRRTGYVKGYALVEYENREDAEKALKEMDGVEVLGKQISVGWAFMKRRVTTKR